MGRDALIGPATAYIAGELRAQRGRLGYTLDELAAKSGVSRSTIDRALKGQTALAVEAFIPICGALGLDPVELVRQERDLAMD